jgi:predicted 3-demethylubiquinone-9 3-methyltransferase (glyoxalase superfamily)
MMAKNLACLWYDGDAAEAAAFYAASFPDTRVTGTHARRVVRPRNRRFPGVLPAATGSGNTSVFEGSSGRL